MKQEDKDLLLQDLCGRLPYGVKGIEANSICLLNTSAHFKSLIKNIEYKIKHLGFKPYLFPMSSMTEEQREEYESLCIKETSECIDISGFSYTKDNYYDTVESIDYLYKNHIDIRGLIPKDLAIDATGLNIY